MCRIDGIIQQIPQLPGHLSFSLGHCKPFSTANIGRIGFSLGFSTATMRRHALTALLSILTSAIFAVDNRPLKPCTIVSPSSGDFYDLNTITKKVNKDDRTESWHSRGYDYGTNFTLNFCAPVIETLEDVVGVDEALWQNVTAFYKLEGKTYSIG
jgi:hypothetical protein